MITTLKAGLEIRHHALKILTQTKLEIRDITPFVREFVRSSGLDDGLIVVSSRHTTTAIFINELQSALMDDFKSAMHDWVREDRSWKHNSPEFSDCERHNATSHLRAALLGNSCTIIVQGGDLGLGEWQSILLAELDGPRERDIRLMLMGA